MEFFGSNVRIRFEPVRYRVFRQTAQLLAVTIVRVQHSDFRRARAGSFEESPFRREIALERFVIVHVLARQVGEHRDLEMAAPQAVQPERVRARLEDRELSTAAADFCEKPLKIHGLGSGVRRGIVA